VSLETIAVPFDVAFGMRISHINRESEAIADLEEGQDL